MGHIKKVNYVVLYSGGKSNNKVEDRQDLPDTITKDGETYELSERMENGVYVYELEEE